METANGVTKDQLKQMIDWAKTNPTDPRALELGRQIASGAYNKFGSVQNSPIKSTSGMSIFANTPEAAAARTAANQKLNQGLGNVIGGGKLAQATGQVASNALGGAKLASSTLQTLTDTQTKLLQAIKENKESGKDTSKLETALQQISESIQKQGNDTTDQLTDGITNKEFVGSALQLAANAIPGVAEEGFVADKAGNILANAGIKTAAEEVAQTTGEKIASRTALGAGQGYAYDVANKLQDENKTTKQDFTPGAGTVVGTALSLLPFGAKLAGALSKHVAGFTSGVGSEVIQRAIDNPDAVGEAVKQYATTPEAKQTLVDRAKAGISEFLQGRSEEYGDTINSIVPSDEISKQPAIESFKSNVQKFGGNVDDKGNLTFQNTTLTKQDQSNLKQAWGVIKGWTDNTAKGLDGLRQAIGNHMNDFKIAGNPRANVILGQVKQDLTSHISDNVPGYSAMLSKYGNQTQTANELVSELGIGGKAKPSTQLTNIMKLFQKDPAVKDGLVKVMGEEDANKFLDEISGAILSDWFPAGKMGNYIRGAVEVGSGAAAAAAGLGAAPVVGALGSMAAISSPRIVGVAARTAGRIGDIGSNAAVKTVGSGIRKAATLAASQATK